MPTAQERAADIANLIDGWVAQLDREARNQDLDPGDRDHLRRAIAHLLAATFVLRAGEESGVRERLLADIEQALRVEFATSSPVTDDGWREAAAGVTDAALTALRRIGA